MTGTVALEYVSLNNSQAHRKLERLCTCKATPRHRPAASLRRWNLSSPLMSEPSLVTESVVRIRLDPSGEGHEYSGKGCPKNVASGRNGKLIGILSHPYGRPGMDIDCENEKVARRQETFAKEWYGELLMTNRFNRSAAPSPLTDTANVIMRTPHHGPPTRNADLVK